MSYIHVCSTAAHVYVIYTCDVYVVYYVKCMYTIYIWHVLCIYMWRISILRQMYLHYVYMTYTIYIWQYTTSNVYTLYIYDIHYIYMTVYYVKCIYIMYIWHTLYIYDSILRQMYIHYIYMTYTMYIYDIYMRYMWRICSPPAPMNHVKYLGAGPAEMPFQNWYTATTNHFRQISVWRKSTRQLGWVLSIVPHNLVRRIRFWRIKSPGTGF